MAIVDDNLFIEGIRGKVGKKLVYKRINGETYATKYPDMSGVSYNKNQIKYQKLFEKAVKYAQGVLRDPERVAAYRKRIHNDRRAQGTSVYHAAIKAYMDMYSTKVPNHEVAGIMKTCRETCTLTVRQEKAIRHLIAQSELTNAIYQQINKVSKPTATRDLQDLVRKGVVLAEAKGAGAKYRLAVMTCKNKIEDGGENEDTGECINKPLI